MFSTNFKSIIGLLVLLVIVYLSVYTWNSRTGVIDDLTARTGLEAVGWVLAPGHWVHDRATALWDRYIDLVNVSQDNERLKNQLQDLQIHISQLREEAAEVKRLRSLLSFSPPPAWTRHGARVIGQRVGPNAVFQTILVNKGHSEKVTENTPVVTAKGVVGRVFKLSANFCSVLILTDPNSRIPVLGQSSRTNGILKGHGSRELLGVTYVPQNELLYKGEVLITSGLGGTYPKGIPVATVESIEHSELSLFQTVQAAPLVDLEHLEEVLLLHKSAHPGHLHLDPGPE